MTLTASYNSDPNSWKFESGSCHGSKEKLSDMTSEEFLDLTVGIMQALNEVLEATMKGDRK